MRVTCATTIITDNESTAAPPGGITPKYSEHIILRSRRGKEYELWTLRVLRQVANNQVLNACRAQFAYFMGCISLSLSYAWSLSFSRLSETNGRRYGGWRCCVCFESANAILKLILLLPDAALKSFENDMNHDHPVRPGLHTIYGYFVALGAVWCWCCSVVASNICGFAARGRGWFLFNIWTYNVRISR